MAWRMGAGGRKPAASVGRTFGEVKYTVGAPLVFTTDCGRAATRCIREGRMVRGVILAAGASSRMGRPKAALPLTDRGDTFTSRLIRTFLAAGMPQVVVVTGAWPDAVRRAAGPADCRVRVIHNPDWEQGQLTSLLAGLGMRSPTTREADVEAAVVTLVDVPLVRPATVATLVRQWRHTRAPIVRPARGDLHGHPVIFDRSLFTALRAADPDQGAKAVVRRHADAILNVPIDDDGAFLDVDTMADYDAIRLRGIADPA